MEKIRTLFNVVVLVLFGSVVPASAQDPQGYGGILQTVVVSVSASLSVVAATLTNWWKVDSKIDAAKRELKDDAKEAHTAIGTNIDKVHSDIDKVHSDIRESERRVTNNFNARFDDLRDYIKLAMNQPRDGRSSGSAQDRP